MQETNQSKSGAAACKHSPVIDLLYTVIQYMSKTRKKERSRRRKKAPVVPMLLSAYNYKILALGVLLVILGFGGMYIEGQQYGIYSLYIAPLLVMTGFILVVIAVFRTDPKLIREDKTRDHSGDSTPTSTSP